jgi:DNA-binding response OmpR family regulator
MTNERLLVIDDEIDFCAFVGRVGRKLYIEVETTTNSSQFKEIYGRFDPTMITLDMMMPKPSGIDLIQWLAERDCTARVFILSGSDANFTAMAEVVGGIAGLASITRLSKPISIADLERAFSAGRA